MPTCVLKADKSYSLKTLLSWFNASHIERTEEAIKLFMCHISPSCEFLKTLQNKSYSCIEIDLHNGDLRMWTYEFNSKKPELIIEGCYARPIHSNPSLSKS